MDKIEATIQQQGETITNLETQLGQLAIVVNGRPNCSLPSNTVSLTS